jgi:hypothetical protein
MQCMRSKVGVGRNRREICGQSPALCKRTSHGPYPPSGRTTPCKSSSLPSSSSGSSSRRQSLDDGHNDHPNECNVCAVRLESAEIGERSAVKALRPCINNNNNTNNMTRSHQLHCHYPDVHFLPPRLQIPVWLLTSSSNQRSEPRDDDGRATGTLQKGKHREY